MVLEFQEPELSYLNFSQYSQIFLSPEGKRLLLILQNFHFWMIKLTVIQKTPFGTWQFGKIGVVVNFSILKIFKIAQLNMLWQFRWWEGRRENIFHMFLAYLKSDNLQYNTLSRWVNGDDRLIDQVIWCSKYFFFHNFLQNSFQKSFQFILFFYNFTKIKSFECRKSKLATHCFIFNLSK